MSRKRDDLLLNKEELALLSEVMLPVENMGNALEYSVNSSSKGESLFSQLGYADKLQLSADYGHHRLVFPVQIERDDFTNLKMTLKPPEIFETGKTSRAWRLLTHDKKIYLINKAGDKQQFQIEDLSASGVSLLIDKNAQSTFPDVLENAFIQLPNRKKLAVSGLKLSRIDDRVVAYSLAKEVDPSVLTSLYEYLFECHLEQYPDAHKSNA